MCCHLEFVVVRNLEKCWNKHRVEKPLMEHTLLKSLTGAAIEPVSLR